VDADREEFGCAGELSWRRRFLPMTAMDSLVDIGRLCSAQDAFLQLQSGMSGLKCFSSTVEAGWDFIATEAGAGMRTPRGLDLHGRR
jgi:hypothetical protein